MKQGRCAREARLARCGQRVVERGERAGVSGGQGDQQRARTRPREGYTDADILCSGARQQWQKERQVGTTSRKEARRGQRAAQQKARRGQGGANKEREEAKSGIRNHCFADCLNLLGANRMS